MSRTPEIEMRPHEQLQQARPMAIAQLEQAESCDQERLPLASSLSPHGRVLLVAFHFPPQAGSSGVLRTLKFCRYLPQFGWLPTVLTVHPRVYDRIDESQLGEIPPQAEILRAFALDSRRHLSWGQRYLKQTALPDRWVSWVLGALPVGLYQIQARHIDAIFTTYPIATSPLIGYLLHRLTGKPWVIDFRDSMTEDNYPFDPATRRVYRWIEQKAIQHGSLFVFTARSAMRMYLERYPALKADRCLLLPNGYDEADFENIQVRPQRDSGKVRLLHSGLIYPWERNPRPFFQALAQLKASGHISRETLAVDLRASGSEQEFQSYVNELGIADLVHFEPALSYRIALSDASDADALLLIQGAVCNHQVPAKTYEYLRLGKPVLALTDGAGDTAVLLEEVGGATIVDPEDSQAISKALPLFLDQVRRRLHPLPKPEAYRRYSRVAETSQLAVALEMLVGKLESR